MIAPRTNLQLLSALANLLDVAGPGGQVKVVLGVSDDDTFAALGGDGKELWIVEDGRVSRVGVFELKTAFGLDVTIYGPPSTPPIGSGSGFVDGG